jgi:hypothetical protein
VLPIDSQLELAVVLQSLLERFRRIGPRDVLQHRVLARQRRDVRPAVDRVVDDPQLAGVRCRVEVELDVVVPEQREPQRIDVVRANALSEAGSSSCGFRVIEYMNRSRPMRGASAW